MRDHLSDVVRASSRTLIQHLRRARTGDVRAVHQARVASRRLREVLPIAGECLRRRDRHSLSRDVRRIARALGRVRELDVAILEFEDDARRQAFDAVAVARLTESLKKERAARLRALRRKMDRVDLKALASGLDELATRCESRPQAGWRAELAARMRKRSKRLAKELRSVGTLYAPESIHHVRIAGKKLRYALELAERAAGMAIAKDLSALKRMQKMLGRLNDLYVLQAYVRDAAAAPAHAPRKTALAAIEKALEAECRELHARFLAKAPAWGELAGRARVEFPLRLVSAPKRHAPLKAEAADRRARHHGAA